MKSFLYVLLLLPLVALCQTTGSVTTIDSVAMLRASAAPYPVVYVSGYRSLNDGGQGVFVYNQSDTTSADNGGTIIVDAAGDRYYRAAEATTALQFGAICNGSVNNGQDDTSAVQNWLNWLQSIGSIAEGSAGSGYMPAGYKCLTSSPLVVTTPITLRFDSWIYYSGTSGSAFVVGATPPSGTRNTGYDISIAGLRAINGNSTLPSGINASGSVGVEVRNMQFSRLAVGNAIAFTRAGIFLNSTNDVFMGQHIQDNSIKLGQIAYNGYGILALSVSASDGAVQVNDIAIENSFANYQNIQLDDAAHNSNTNNNIFTINSMDNPAPGGSAGNVYGSYNKIVFGYLSGTLTMASAAYNNRIEIMNPMSTGSGISYSTASGNNNWAQTSTPSPNALPTTKSITPGVAYQNTSGVPIFVTVSVQLKATSTSNEVGAAYLGQEANQMQTVNFAQVFAASVPAPAVFPLCILVPPGWYYEFNGSGGGTAGFSAASITQAG
jgi:hypothetical protein